MGLAASISTSPLSHGDRDADGGTRDDDAMDGDDGGTKANEQRLVSCKTMMRMMLRRLQVLKTIESRFLLHPLMRSIFPMICKDGMIVRISD